MKRPDFIANYRDVVGEDNCSYPGSKELLSYGAPIGRKLGLTSIGLHVELLEPGRRTSWPHAEEKEEEFVFVLEGTPDAWIDGHLHRMEPGDLAAFPAGTGIAHTFINNTDSLVRLLVGGDANIKDNRIFYPLHPARNEQCREKGWFWEEHPKHELGPHSGAPNPRITRLDDGTSGSFVIRNPEGGEHLAEMDYRWMNGVMVIHHTGVRDALKGQGIAGKLVAAGVSAARAEGFRIQPVCSYVAHKFSKSPEAYADVVA